MSFRSYLFSWSNNIDYFAQIEQLLLSGEKEKTQTMHSTPSETSHLKPLMSFYWPSLFSLQWHYLELNITIILSRAIAHRRKIQTPTQKYRPIRIL